MLVLRVVGLDKVMPPAVAQVGKGDAALNHYAVKPVTNGYSENSSDGQLHVFFHLGSEPKDLRENQDDQPQQYQ